LGNTFKIVGVAELSSTKRSVRLKLSHMPNTVFTEYLYVSCKDLEDLLKGHKKTGTIYVLKERERP